MCMSADLCGASSPFSSLRVLSFGGLRGGSALYLLFSLQCRVARSNERPSAARSGAKCLLELTLTYLERLVATRCAWVPLCCASVRAHFHTLTTGSALNSAQAAKANAATSANPDGRISRAGNLIGAGVAADDASDSSLADQESNKSLLESDEDMSSEHSQSSEEAPAGCSCSRCSCSRWGVIPGRARS